MSFDPTQISGLQLWLDASQPTTLTNSPTAAPPAPGNITSGTLVGTWYDNSGNGNHFSQSNSTYQPTYYSSGGHIGSGAYVSFVPPSASGGYTTDGPTLTERTANLHTICATNNTVLMLLYKGTSSLDGTYQAFFTNNVGGSGAEFLLRISGKFTRYNGSAGVTMSEGATHALVYTYASSGTVETFYIDSAASAGATYTSGRTGMTSSAFEIGDEQYSINGQVCEYLVYNSALLNTQIAQIFAYWNTKWGTSFNASAGPLTTGSLQVTSVTKTSQTVISSSPSGGTSPYTYQWYRSTTSGTASAIAVSGNLISGATSLTLNDTGLTLQTTYYYVLQTTDSATPTANVVLSAVLTAPTHGNTTVKIGFIGDSITYGAESTVPPPTAAQTALQSAYPRLDVQVTDYGVDGQQFRYYSRLTYSGGTNGSSGVVSLLTTLQAAGITYVSIMEGTNDWAAGPGNGGSDTSFSPANYAADMVNVTSYLTAAGITCFVNQLIYRTTSGADSSSTGLPAWNAELASLSYGGLLDQGDTSAYAYFKANTSELADGLHPNTAGSVTLGDYWASAIGPVIAATVLPASSGTQWWWG
jgi:lysophospholipase L1-like esterase